MDWIHALRSSALERALLDAATHVLIPAPASENPLPGVQIRIAGDAYAVGLAP